MKSLRTRSRQNPNRNLVVIFAFWKVGLLIIAACSPGPGYDTSASLNISSNQKELPLVVRHVAEKLTRWDAIYFTEIAHRGYLFEQEWAFGWGLTQLVALCTVGLKSLGLSDIRGIENIVAIGIAHTSHLLSVLTLFYLTSNLFPEEGPEFSFGTAVLHVISPAGIFLSAPYAESSCAFFSFLGCFVFSESFKAKSTAKRDIQIVLTGLIFGVASLFRSNACFNGLLLLEEALRILLNFRNGFQPAIVRHFLATIFGGLLIAVGLLGPQFYAYYEYCIKRPVIKRPWCFRSFPSIYQFVQGHYWDVGMFRYWKVSNIPLFFLSAPMLALIVASGFWALRLALYQKKGVAKAGREIRSTEKRYQIIRNLAVSQMLLAILTFTTAHVQIITRISSSYPVWLWYTAKQARNKEFKYSGYIVRYMVIYGIVQAGLYSSFLPPA